MTKSEFFRNLTLLKSRVIHYDRFTEYVQLLEERMQMAHIIDEPSSLGILGESGVGKTCIGRYFQKKYPHRLVEEDDGDRRIAPVIYMRMPPTRTLSDTIKYLLHSLGILHSGRDTIPAMTINLLKALRNARTELVFLDEIQHLYGGHGASTTMVKQWIKGIIDDSNIPFVFMGTPNSQSVLSGEELGRRVTPINIVQPFDFPTKEGDSLVRCLAAISGLAIQDCGFSIKKADHPITLAQRLWLAGGGRIGQMKSMIMDAMIIAHRRNERDVSLKTFAQAYTSSPPLSSAVKKGNPFEMTPSQLSDAA